MVFHITPSTGIDLEYVGDLPYYDMDRNVPSPQLGSKVVGSDGYNYIFVSASANIAAASAPGSQIAVTDTYTAATDNTNGTFYAPVAGVTSGQYFWARSAER